MIAASSGDAPERFGGWLQCFLLSTPSSPAPSASLLPTPQHRCNSPNESTLNVTALARRTFKLGGVANKGPRNADAQHLQWWWWWWVSMWCWCWSWVMKQISIFSVFLVVFDADEADGVPSTWSSNTSSHNNSDLRLQAFTVTWHYGRGARQSFWKRGRLGLMAHIETLMFQIQ